MTKPVHLLFAFIVVLATVELACGQTMFQKEYGIGGERGTSVKQTFDGGFVVAGMTGSPSDVLLMKTDALGNILWARSYGGPEDDNVYYLQQTSDSGFVMVGSTSSFGQGGSDVYLIKTDKDGNEQFSKTYGGPLDDEGDYVGQLPDDGFMIAGQTSSYGAGSQDCYVIRTTADGTMLWANTYGGDNTDEAYSARVTRDGGLVMAGITWTFLDSAYFDAYIVRVDSNGNLQWGRSVDFGGVHHAQEAFDVMETLDGGILVSVEPEYVIDSFSNGDFALLKFDALGNLVWKNPVQGWKGWEFGYAIRQMPDSGFMVAGLRGLLSATTTRAVIYRSDKNGNVLWYRSYGDSLHACESESMDITSDGGFVLAGYIYDNMLGYDGQKIYLIKTDSAGNTGYCNESSDTPPNVIPNLVITPGGVQGSGGVEGSAATITTLLFLQDTTLPCGPLILPCPTAAFSFSSTCPADSASFTDLSTDPDGASHLTQWIWNYQDGQSDTFYSSTNPKHKYAKSGTYPVQLSVTNDAFCTNSTTNLVIITSIAHAGLITAQPDTICQGNVVQLSITGDTGAIQWQYALSGNNFADITGAVNPLLMDSPQQTTYYRLVALVGNCADTSLAVKLLVNPQPAVPIVTSPDSIVCPGDTTRPCTTNIYLSYLWNTNDTGFCTYAASAGSYRVSVTDANGCSAESKPLNIYLYPAPVPPVVTAADSIICSGDTTQVCTTNTYLSYLWNTNDTSYCTNATTARGYWVTVTDANHCSAVSKHQEIFVYPVPAVSITERGDTLSSHGAVSYQWYLNNVPIPNAIDSEYIAKQSGEYAVQITDSNGCTSVSNPVANTGITDLGEEDILIYPNPTDGSWQLAVGNKLVGSTLEVYDNEGRVIFKSEIRNSKSEIKLNVAKGIYWLRISNEQQSIIRKIVKV